jgi:lipid A 3-O-deacylase
LRVVISLCLALFLAFPAGASLVVLGGSLPDVRRIGGALRTGAMTATFVVLLVVLAVKGRAQDEPPPAAVVRFELDNDFLALRGAGAPPDYDYTHGMRVSVVRPTAPAWIARTIGAPACTDARAIGSACVLSGFSVGQEIYTPRHNVPEPVFGDRPHAAWLFSAVQLRRIEGTGLQSLDLRAGVTGPAALGEPVQNGVHRLLHNQLEAGWDHQLPTRLGIIADYDATRSFGPRSSHATSRFVAADVGATVGTLRRAVRVGTSAYFGFGPPRPASADAPLIARPARFYVTGGYHQFLVLYDAFVEGVGGTPGAVRLPWVGEADAAVGMRLHRFALDYRYVSRGREYRAEPGRHSYGAIALSIAGR